MCGIHAQVMSCAELPDWARRDDATAESVPRALWEERSLVRTWCMRGTLHLLTPEQLGLYAAAFDPDALYDAQWLRYFELTADDMEQVRSAVCWALDAGEAMSRRQLADAVSDRLEPRLATRLRSGWGELLKPIARRGLIVNGPGRGQEITYVRTDRWLGVVPRVEPAEARIEWLRRYLCAYAPATRQDYAGSQARGSTAPKAGRWRSGSAHSRR